ncbi:MAG: low temperature requirement protein A [Bifidobacteriaceae bacterium]|jgi:low temperature requirement protein LtrA|nr:low temperature requirement protein A [Bifidobacteriaceae bacterium]
MELFFDLVFTVAVAGSSAGLFAVESHGQIPRAILSYAMVFFTIWWAWLNFTWFASAFDTDDWLYRLTTIVQMGGALIIAAGARPAMTDLDFSLVTKGYVLVRLAMVAQWLRAGSDSQGYRGVAWRWAGGIAIVQMLWLVRMWWTPGSWGLWTFTVLVAFEVAIPPLAQWRRHIPWHPRHIAERYGLFTLIVLGESILASANAVIDATGSSRHPVGLLTMAAAGLILAAAMWWVYFARPMHQHLGTIGAAFGFGYLHYVVFAAVGAFSSGIDVMIQAVEGKGPLGPVAAAATVTIPVAVFTLSVWWMALRVTLSRWANSAALALIAAVVATPWLGAGILPAAVAMSGLAALLEVASHVETLTRRPGR